MACISCHFALKALIHGFLRFFGFGNFIFCHFLTAWFSIFYISNGAFSFPPTANSSSLVIEMVDFMVIIIIICCPLSLCTQWITHIQIIEFICFNFMFHHGCDTLFLGFIFGPLFQFNFEPEITTEKKNMRFLSVDSCWLASVFISFSFLRFSLVFKMLVSRWEQNEMNSIYNFRTWP